MRIRTYKAVILLAIFLIAEVNFTAHILAYEPLENSLENIIFVGKDGGIYNSIQEAIDNAPEGTTILVKAGSYNEIIDIKKAICLIGENKEATIINPISERNKYALCLGAPGAMIKNFSVTNGALGLYTTGIRVSAQATEIINCDIYNTPVGIAVWSSDNIIDSCTFWGCKDEGIALIGSEYSNCNKNTINNCLFYDNCDGIELQYSSNNIISFCKFYDNTHTGIDAISSSNNENTISNCEIFNNTVHGIYLSGSSRNKITSCLISKNNDGNIVTYGDCFDNDIEGKEDNNIEPNQETSISLKVLEEFVQSFQLNNEINTKSSIISRILEFLSNLIPYLKSLLNKFV